jgi:hypothetical protein
MGITIPASQEKCLPSIFSRNQMKIFQFQNLCLIAALFFLNSRISIHIVSLDIAYNLDFSSL